MNSQPDTIAHDADPDTALSHEAGAEPLPGYRLLEPLGSGGFGEVWKCEVPGGLCKAIKFVRGSLNQLDGGGSARQELDALQRVKGIRHPFVLSMERVEVVNGELMIVMELADRNLHDLCQDYITQGLPGIPRGELLSYLLEAAEALDLMNFQHDLQHLDIKPRNLFVVSNHVKVADFGLVHSLPKLSGQHTPAQQSTGITPQYAAPEVFRASISRHSDQYSLAIVYQELLTGVQPFTGRNARQLMMHHLMTTPNLEALPSGDRALVGRALAKDSEQRFGSCLEFINALVYASGSLSDWLPVDAQGRLNGANRKKDSKGSRRSLSMARAALAVAMERQGASNPTAGNLAPATPARAAEAESNDLLPGHRFLECLHRSPLAEVWKVQDQRGQGRLAQCLPGNAGLTPNLLERLRDLRHPGLQPREVLTGRGGRVVVLDDPHRRTLRERLKECSAQGRPGIARTELLDALGQAAEVLDHFAGKQVPHLGLHPRCLVLDDDDRVRVADLGLIALAWQPTNAPAGPLNPRYAAPELDRAGGDGAADQYSLAVMYVELLTGTHPLRKSTGRGTTNHGHPKPDLDLLPATDRAVVARALDPDPRHRHDGCVAFIHALKSGGAAEAARLRARAEQLPPVLPVAQLLGEKVHSATPPTAAELAGCAIAEAAGAQQLGSFSNFRYRIHGETALEHRCPVRLYSGGLPLKLQGFHDQWKGKLLQQTQVSCSYRIFGQRSLWQSCIGAQPGLDVHVHLEPTVNDSQLFLGTIRVQPVGSAAGKLFQELGPVVLQSLRNVLQVTPEKRTRERWAYEQRLLLYPVLPSLELGEVIQARGKDISPGDVGFFLRTEPEVELLYVQLGPMSPLADYAVLARIVRTRQCEAGFEVGAVFVNERRSETD